MTLERRARTARSRLAHPIVTTSLVAAVAFLLYGQVSAKYDTVQAQQQSQELAEPLDQLCRDDPDARRQVGDARCGQAADVRDDPTSVPGVGRDGRDGRDGRGIAATTLADGHLLVTFTDGVVDDLGVVVGPTGATGAIGPNGRGIVATTLVADALIVTYADGARETVGRVVGRDGATGRGIVGTEATDGRLLVTYDDGTTVDVGPLPVGPAGPPGATGPPGRGVATLDLDLDRCELTIRYDDDTSEVKTITGCRPGDTEGNEPPAPLLPAS